MKLRCTNPNMPQWKDWGGRGITFVPEWEAFEQFFADMGECPDGLTLDRIDNNRGYGPDNCRWADYSTQFRNRRSNQWVTLDGTRMIFADAVRTLGLKTSTPSVRMFKRGWTHQQTIDWYAARRHVATAE